MNPLLTIEAAYALPKNTFIGLRLTPQRDPENTVLLFAFPSSTFCGFRIGTEFHPNHGETIDYRPMLLLPQPRLEAEAAENLWAAVYPDRGPWSTIGEEARAEWRHFLEVALAQNAEDTQLAAERERCAKIAEAVGQEERPGAHTLCDVVAERIRGTTSSLQSATDPWIPVTEASLPPFNVPVWLKLPDGSRILGERVNEPEGWLWARCYSPPWFDQDTQTWEGQNSEEDDDYQPTHYALLPA